MRNVETVEKYISYSMCGFFFANAMSVAAGNIFMVISIILTIYRLWIKHDDVAERFATGKKWLAAFGVFLLVVVISALVSGDVGFCLKSFFNYYIFRPIGFFVIMAGCCDKKRLMSMLMAGLAGLFINGGITAWSWLVLGQRTGGFLPTMSMAGILSMVVPVFISLAVIKEGKERLLAVCITMLLMVAVVANGTRGAWMAIFITAVAAVCLIMNSWKKRLSALLLCVALVAGAVSGGGYIGSRTQSIFKASDNSSMERFYLWQSAYNMYDDNKLLGVGIQRFGKLYPTKYILPEAKYRELGHAHSNIFQVLAECGAIGLLAVLVLWGRLLQFGISGWLRTKFFSYLAIFCMISGLLLQGLTEYSWGNAVVMKYFWCLLAVCTQLINIEANLK